ncbi:MAG: WD40/YVTN/BNR-like repeat-containing protein, partial [Cyclobacteriaceae bacterium]
MSTLIKSMVILAGSILVLSCQNISNLESEGQTSSKCDINSNWTLIGPGGGGSTFIPTFSYSSPERFMIRCDMTGAYITHDGGTSYSIITNPNGSYSFGFDPENPETIYLGTSSLKRSRDGGKTWSGIFPKQDEIKEETYSGDHANYRLIAKKGTLLTEEGGHQSIRNIKVDPLDSNSIYFSVNENFYFTTDGGSSWKRIEIGQSIDYIYTNQADLESSVYIFSNSGLTILDKYSWEKSYKEYSEQMQSVFSFTGGVIKNTGKTVFYTLQNTLEDKAYGGISPTTIWRSTDLGNTWKQINDQNILNRQGPVPTYSKLATAENDAAKVYVVTSDYQEPNSEQTMSHWYGTLKSEDAGETWHWVWKGGGGSGQYSVKDGVDASNLEDAWVRGAFGGEYIRLIDVGVAPNNGDVAIVTDWYRAMKTTDGGKNWVEVYSEKQPDGSYISRGLDVTTAYGVHFDPFDRNHIAISYTDIGYHHSFDGGRSWFRSTEGIPPKWHNTCYWMVFDPEEKNKIYSVWSGLHDFPRGKMTRNPKWTEYGQGGVAISTNGGKSWSPSVEGMGYGTPSTSIVLDENSPVRNRTLYVAAYGKGVFKSIDDGKSWELRNNGISGSLAAFELTLQPDGTLFLVTSPTPQHKNGQVGREVHMGALYKSTDGAESWQQLTVNDRVKFPNGLAYDPKNLDKLYLGSWSDIT